MEATVEEASAYNRSITDGVAQLSKQLDETTHSLEEKEREKSTLTENYQKVVEEMQAKQVRVAVGADGVGGHLRGGRRDRRGGGGDPRVRESGGGEGARDPK